MTDWLATCRAAVEDVRGVLAELPRRADREPVVGTGHGRRRHDRDRRGGRAGGRRAVRRLRRGLHARLGGARHPRAAADTWVVLDPIDGSINAKRGLPFFSLSVAIAEGGTMDDVVFGYVYDFGTRRGVDAERGGGARLNGAPLSGEPPKDRIELLALEATRTDLVARARAGARRPRRTGCGSSGSLALSLCHLADGRVDAVCSLKGRARSTSPPRSCSSASGATRSSCSSGRRSAAAPLDLEGRSRVVAAGSDGAASSLGAQHLTPSASAQPDGIGLAA